MQCECVWCMKLQRGKDLACWTMLNDAHGLGIFEWSCVHAAIFFSRELGDPWKHQIESQILKDSMHTGCANSHVVTRVVYREACDHHGSSPCDVRPGSHCLQPSENSLNKTMKSAWNSDEILHKIYKICTVAPSNFYKTRDVTQTLDSEVWAKSRCHCFDALRPACGSSPQASPALSRRWEGLFWWQVARTDK